MWRQIKNICPIFIIDAGGAAVNVLCWTAGAAVRLPLAREVVAEVTVEFSTDFGMPDAARPQLALEPA